MYYTVLYGAVGLSLYIYIYIYIDQNTTYTSFVYSSVLSLYWHNPACDDEALRLLANMCNNGDM